MLTGGRHLLPVIFASHLRQSASLSHFLSSTITIYIKKTFLFGKDDAGGEDLAVIMTLIQSCELLGVNPRKWLLKAFSRIAGQQEYNPIDLLPFNYVKETNEAKSNV